MKKGIIMVSVILTLLLASMIVTASTTTKTCRQGAIDQIITFYGAQNYGHAAKLFDSNDFPTALPGEKLQHFIHRICN